jgi:transmembrane protein DUF3566
VTEPRDPAPGERPRPIAPQSAGGWPDLPGWSAPRQDPIAPKTVGPSPERSAPTPNAPRQTAPVPAPPPTRQPAGGDGQSTARPAPRPSATQPAAPPDPDRAGSLAGAAKPSVSTATVTPRTGPRRARLTVHRVDPWSVLRFSFLASLAMLVVFLVAVMVLYGVLAGMHVFSTINDQLHSLTGTDTSGGLHVNFSFGRVLGISLIVGVVNTVLFTALATLGAFVYNLVADMVGGIEVVLAERE